jgi:hypothetical protein
MWEFTRKLPDVTYFLEDLSDAIEDDKERANVVLRIMTCFARHMIRVILGSSYWNIPIEAHEFWDLTLDVEDDDFKVEIFSFEYLNLLGNPAYFLAVCMRAVIDYGHTYEGDFADAINLVTDTVPAAMQQYMLKAWKMVTFDLLLLDVAPNASISIFANYLEMTSALFKYIAGAPDSLNFLLSDGHTRLVPWGADGTDDLDVGVQLMDEMAQVLDAITPEANSATYPYMVAAITSSADSLYKHCVKFIRDDEGARAYLEQNPTVYDYYYNSGKWWDEQGFNSRMRLTDATLIMRRREGAIWQAFTQMMLYTIGNKLDAL